MTRPITDLKNNQLGQDVYVLCAGPSMNYFRHDFFDNKITVGVNRICKFFKCNYIVSKDTSGFAEILKHRNDAKIVLSKHVFGDFGGPLNTLDVDYYVFDHPSKPEQRPNLKCIQENSNEIVVSHSTATSAIHLAAYFGAKNIFICGHDCCEVDGQAWVAGYYENIHPMQESKEEYVSWLSSIKEHTTRVSQKLIQEFGCNIYKISPFLFR